MTEKERKNKREIHLLVHFLNACNGKGVGDAGMDRNPTTSAFLSHPGTSFSRKLEIRSAAGTVTHSDTVIWNAHILMIVLSMSTNAHLFSLKAKRIN